MKKLYFLFTICCLLYLNVIAQQNFWQPTNGPMGGYIKAVACTPNNEIFAGTIGHGIYRSTDNGSTWSPTSPTSIYNRVHSLGVNHNGYIYAGVQYLSTSYFIEDLYRSTDNGNSWTASGHVERLTISIAFNSAGDIFAGTKTHGVFRSTNDGETWAQINSGLTSPNIFSLAVNTNGDILAGTPSGIFRSTNNGANWNEINSGLTSLDVKTIAVSSNANIFCGTFGGGVFRSTDNGNSWVQINNGLTNLNINSLSVNSAGYIYAGSWGDGIFYSSDNGNNWTQLNTGLTNGFINKIDINGLGKIFTGTEGGGIFGFDNNSSTWLNTGFNITEINGLAINPGGDIFAAVNTVGISRSTDNGNSWAHINSGLLNPYAYSIVFNASGDVFAGTGKSYYDGGLFKSTNNGDNWFLCGFENIPIRSLFITISGEILAGTWGRGLYRSTDNGSNWQQIPGTDFNSVYSFAINSSGELFAATNNGVYRSINFGLNWTFVPGLPSNTRLLSINSNDDIFAGILYTGASLYRSIDNGITSTVVWNGPFYTIAIDSSDQIFLGYIGIYYSSDNGDNWIPINSGLPNLSTGIITPVGSFVVNPEGYVFAGTTASGVYRSVNSTTSIKDIENPPLSFFLSQNYPNPFNPSTVIIYQLPTAGNVKLKVYDLLGREVANLVEEYKLAGSYEIEFNAGNLTSGVYFYRLQAGSFVETKKLVLLK